MTLYFIEFLIPVEAYESAYHDKICLAGLMTSEYMEFAAHVR